MASDTAFGVVKEFIPDIGRSLAKHHRQTAILGRSSSDGARNKKQ
jgi:hypothetical protein